MDTNHVINKIINLVFQVWTVIIGYILSLIFLWTPSSSGVISMFSLPVWIMFLLHLVSLTGSYRILFFMLLVICSVVGCITGVSEGQDQGKIIFFQLSHGNC